MAHSAARITLLAVVATMLIGPQSSPGDTTAANGLRLTRIGTFDTPVFVAQAPGDRARLFVVERGTMDAGGSRIMVVRGGRKLARPFIDLTDRVAVDFERGLLSVAFAPDYPSSGRFYVMYTAREPLGKVMIEEFRRSPRDPDRADPGSGRIVLEHTHPFERHNGGQLQFGPDGMLYASIGDGYPLGDAGNPAQRLDSRGGKLIRIDPRPSADEGYTVPVDNPFVTVPSARPEIFAYGLRNPWRFSFDRLAGDLAIGDVGDARAEEIDFLPAAAFSRGANFGWSRFEGSRPYYAGGGVTLNPAAPYLPPVHEYFHAGDPDLEPSDPRNCSITGGYTVRDGALPRLQGGYVYGDYCAGYIRVIRLGVRSASDDTDTGLRVDQLTSFGEDLDCRIYVASLAGPVYRLEPRGGGPRGCQPDAGFPELRGARMLRTLFRVAPGSTPTGARGVAPARAARAAGRGSAFAYALSEPALVAFRIRRLAAGRRAGDGCVAPAPALAQRPGCLRSRLVVTLLRIRDRGWALTPFTGRIDARALAPGYYAAALEARDATGWRSQRHWLRFAIAPG